MAVSIEQEETNPLWLEGSQQEFCSTKSPQEQLMQADVSPSELQIRVDQQQEQVDYLLEKLREEEKFKYRIDEVQKSAEESQRQMQNEIDGLLEDAGQKRSTITKLENQIDELRYEVAECEGQLDMAKEQATSREREIDQLKREVKEKSMRYNELLASMEEKIKREADEAYRISANSYEERMARLMEQRRDLEEQLQRRDYLTENVDSVLEQREAEFQEEREAYEERLAQLQDTVWNRDQNYYIKDQQHRELLELYHRKDPVEVPRSLLDHGYKPSMVSYGVQAGRTELADGSVAFGHCASTETQTEALTLTDLLPELPSLSHPEDIHALVQQTQQLTHSTLPASRRLITDTLDQMQRACDELPVGMTAYQLLAKLLLKVPGYFTALSCAVRSLASAAVERDDIAEESTHLRGELRQKEKDIKTLRLRMRELLDKYHKMVQENEFMVQELENMAGRLEETEEKKKQYKLQASQQAAEAARLRRELAYARSFASDGGDGPGMRGSGHGQAPPAPTTPQQTGAIGPPPTRGSAESHGAASHAGLHHHHHQRHHSMSYHSSSAAYSGGGMASGQQNRGGSMPTHQPERPHLGGPLRNSDVGPHAARAGNSQHFPAPSSGSIDSAQYSGSIGHHGGQSHPQQAMFGARSELMLRGYQQVGSEAMLDAMSTGSSGQLARGVQVEAPPRGPPPHIRVMSTDQLVTTQDHGRDLRQLRSDRDQHGRHVVDMSSPEDDVSHDMSVDEVRSLRQEVLQVIDAAPNAVRASLSRADLFSVDGLLQVLEWLDQQVEVQPDMHELTWMLDTLRSKVEARGLTVGTARSSAASSARDGRVTRIVQHLQTRETMQRIIEN